MRRIIFLLLLAAGLGVLGWRIYIKLSEKQESGWARERRPLPVEVSPVSRCTVRDAAEFTGTLLPNSEFMIAPKVPGRLEKLLVDIGDPVRSGDLIAVLDGDEYAQQVAQASAELEVSRANLAESKSALDVAAREYERAKELREQKIASEADLDEAEARYRAAQAKYEVAEAQIKQNEAALGAAQVRLSYTRIHAFWENNGESRAVSERFVHEGTMLRANEPIVSIVDLRSVIAVINVIERDFPEIRIGQIATVTTDAYENRQFTGRVVRRAPVLREESRQARVEIEIPNPEDLLAPGMFVRAYIQFGEHQDALVVPFAALVRRNGRQGVFLVDTDAMKVQFVPVEVGIVEGDLVEIVEPQLEGMVVTLGQHLLEDGASVVLPEGEPHGDQPSSSSPSSATPGPGIPEAQQ
jgi:RND family efflux transporter MFP subunit